MDVKEKLIEIAKIGRVCIYTHRFPDMDAIACLYGIKKVIKSINNNAIVNLFYSKSIGHEQVEFALNKLNLKEHKQYVYSNGPIIYVDMSKYHDYPEPDLVFDHHFNTELYCINDRRKTSSCSSIVSEYLFKFDAIDIETATLLYLGILIDSKDRIEKFDKNMLIRLEPYIDEKIVKDVLEFDYNINMFVKKCIENSISGNNFIICNAGYVKYKDYIGEACSLIKKKTRKKIACVFGDVGDVFYLSVRGDSNILEFVKEISNDYGGREGYAGCFIEKTNFDGIKILEKISIL